MDAIVTETDSLEITGTSRGRGRLTKIWKGERKAYKNLDRKDRIDLETFNLTEKKLWTDGIESLDVVVDPN